MRPNKLSAAALGLALEGLPGWALTEDQLALSRSFRFADFKAAFAFMTRIAEFAEALDHHPDWSNSYNRVDVLLTTHDQGGVTELDVRLARECNEALDS